MDLVKKQIDKWYLKFRPYFFKYTQGFYELAFLVNSPQVMVQGFEKMAFANYDKGKHLVSSNNPFMKSELIHLELEDELILFLSKSVFKKNVKFKLLYDKEIPSEYYFLRYQITQKDNQNRASLSDGIAYTVNTWLFYKPGSAPDNYYFKDTSGTFYTVYFTEKWLRRYLARYDPVLKRGLEHFLNSSQEYLIYPDENKNIDCELFQKTITSKPEIASLDLMDFRNTTYMVLADFMNSLNESSVTEQFFLLSNSDRVKIIQAEKYLRKYLFTEFPGIEHIADKIGIAQTSLKNGFKLVYGTSVYKYYQAEKMLMAADRLRDNPDLKIAQLALEMGYENASKFSAAFKENIGVTPSEYISMHKI